jgi:hypothetical protein
MTKRASMSDLLAIEFGLTKIEYTEYLEIESLEWIENVPENIKQKSVFIITKAGQKSQTVNAKNYDYNAMKIINNYSKEGWKVVNFTDTFIYRNRGNPSVPKIDILQRRKCYLLNRTSVEYIKE